MTRWDIHFADQLPSTMDWAKARAHDGAPDFTGVVAAEQTAGRGRVGRQWSSPQGNLYFSFLLKIPGPACGLMSLSLAVALHDALRPLVPEHISIELKWPNDVLVDGRKIAGILIEREGDHAIIGMGVNLRHAPDGASSLSEWHETDPKTFLPLLQDAIGKLYDEADPAKVVTRWSALAAYRNREIAFRHGADTLSGVFEGVDANGLACVRIGDETRRFASGEVMEVRPCS